jgi:D-alanyl-D-alanine carboxypeptidase (penicillin-binding protein 5/6)
VLAIVTCTFFALFGDASLPAWILGNGTPNDDIEKDPTKDYPYATKTDKSQFVATSGGTSLSGLNINSDYAILVKLSDMSTLAYQNADEAIYPASMTKIMTVITALDYIEDLDDVYVVTRRVLSAVPYDASTASLAIYLDNGDDKVTVRDLLYGISYRSGADSVICLLDYFNLSLEGFVEVMNKKAEEIGLKDTHFGGAIGMDAEENQTTCRDMAAILAYAMENEYARELFSGGKHPLDLMEGYSYYHSTLDTLLGNMYTNAESVLGANYTILAAKSGLETKAGYCLASYIKNDTTGELFVLVTAHADKSEEYPPAQNPILDMVKIFDRVEP